MLWKVTVEQAGQWRIAHVRLNLEYLQATPASENCIIHGFFEQTHSRRAGHAKPPCPMCSSPSRRRPAQRRFVDGSPAGFACSVDTLRWWHVVHLVIQWLVDHCSVIQLHSRLLHVWLVQKGQRVFHPHLVIALWVVFVSVRSTLFLTSLSGHHLLARLIKQIFKLKSLNEVRVPDHAAILDTYILILLHDLRDLHSAFLQISGIPVNRS